MKIVIVSDSHLNDKVLTTIRNRHLEEANIFLHCGDSQLMSGHPALEGYVVVRGNCDFDLALPTEYISSLDETHTLFMTHGHLFDIKYSVHRLHYKALELGANIVCFGHSHFIGCEVVDGIAYINPGSVVLPRNTREKTYAILTIEQNITVSFVEVSTGECILQKELKL
ncbi:MAG: YfcE family phosphodiesterase [Turicibacter sp.]